MAARVRSFFPETLFWDPSIITDDQGRADISIPLADSITTWQLSLLGNSLDGRLGSETKPIRAFQELFVDMELPVSLVGATQ